jgi:hypothetical protein
VCVLQVTICDAGRLDKALLYACQAPRLTVPFNGLSEGCNQQLMCRASSGTKVINKAMQDQIKVQYLGSKSRV